MEEKAAGQDQSRQTDVFQLKELQKSVMDNRSRLKTWIKMMRSRRALDNPKAAGLKRNNRAKGTKNKCFFFSPAVQSVLPAAELRGNNIRE